VSSSSGDSSNFLREIGTTVGLALSESLIKDITKNVITRKDFLFFSLTNFEFDGVSEIIGVGVLGNVYISDSVITELNKEKDKIKTALNRFNKNTNGSSDNQKYDTVNSLVTPDRIGINDNNQIFPEDNANNKSVENLPNDTSGLQSNQFVDTTKKKEIRIDW
jgi:hypothetical protein